MKERRRKHVTGAIPLYTLEVAGAQSSGPAQCVRRLHFVPVDDGDYSLELKSNRGGESTMKAQTRVVVIGGGVVGASVLYHLTKIGWSDVMLLEKHELTSGSSWHAAGGVHTYNSDANVSRL